MSALTLVWVGYQGVRVWQGSATLLAERRVADAADLLVTAITRDIRGAQESVLGSAEWQEALRDPAFDSSLRHVAARAFARYPYPDAFFAWRERPTPPSVVFFARADRTPSWIPTSSAPSRFPVVLSSEPRVAGRLIDRVTQDAEHGRRYSIFDLALDGRSYQVMARLLYRDEYREPQTVAVFGFMVDMDWVRLHYFQDLTKQIARIAGPDLVLSVHTEVGERIATTALEIPGVDGRMNDAPSAQRVFPLMFFDPRRVMVASPPDLARVSWVAEAVVPRDPLLTSARQGAVRSLSIATVAALVLLVGLAMSARAAYTQSKLAEIRSDFVATVTHELKTPIASIRALGETLSAGRVSEPKHSQEYAGLVVQEAKRLTRLVDNLLAYARITDITEIYSFEPLYLETLVDSALREFVTQLRGADMRIDVPHELPPVLGDRMALGLVLDNILDNAIHYSGETPWIKISAHVAGSNVVVEVADRGSGIPENEIARVMQRGFRGRGAHSGGSGLGLALSDRIVSDHRGSLTVRSTVGVGTTVTIILPSARFGHEATRSRR